MRSIVVFARLIGMGLLAAAVCLVAFFVALFEEKEHEEAQRRETGLPEQELDRRLARLRERQRRSGFAPAPSRN